MNAMTSNIDRAVEVIDAIEQVHWQHLFEDGTAPRDIAQALADAGLLITDEIQAILDALHDERSSFRYSEPINVPLAAAIRAYLARRTT